jgi:hypothetical protein
MILSGAGGAWVVLHHLHRVVVVRYIARTTTDTLGGAEAGYAGRSCTTRVGAVR